MKRLQAILDRGYCVAPRDKRINTNYVGKYMIAEDGYWEDDLPTADGSNGPWCIVGDNLPDLIEQAWRFAP